MWVYPSWTLPPITNENDGQNATVIILFKQLKTYCDLEYSFFEEQIITYIFELNRHIL